jgi:hypothetical protein
MNQADRWSRMWPLNVHCCNGQLRFQRAYFLSIRWFFKVASLKADCISINSRGGRKQAHKSFRNFASNTKQIHLRPLQRGLYSLVQLLRVRAIDSCRVLPQDLKMCSISGDKRLYHALIKWCRSLFNKKAIHGSLIKILSDSRINDILPACFAFQSQLWVRL